jgi:hypothetical protein
VSVRVRDKGVDAGDGGGYEKDDGDLHDDLDNIIDS